MTRTETRTARPTVAMGWPAQLGISAAFGGFLMLMGAISFPLPWTPVPFSMIPFGLLVAGAYQRPQWAGLSVVIYLLAGALGAPVYAEGSSGWEHLVGPTAGYLIGFVLVSAFVAWYVKDRRSLMPRRWAYATIGLVAVVAIWSLVAIVRFVTAGESLGTYDAELSGWGIERSVLWVLVYLTAATTVITLWALGQHREKGARALNLFLVFLAATALLHVCGVTVLWALTDLSLLSAIILGSVVFLPFDIVKAGLAVGVSLPFLPEPSHDH